MITKRFFFASKIDKIHFDYILKLEIFLDIYCILSVENSNNNSPNRTETELKLKINKRLWPTRSCCKYNPKHKCQNQRFANNW